MVARVDTNDKPAFIKPYGKIHLFLNPIHSENFSICDDYVSFPFHIFQLQLASNEDFFQVQNIFSMK